MRWRSMSSVFHMVHAGLRLLKKISTAPVPHRSTWTSRSVMFSGALPCGTEKRNGWSAEHSFSRGAFAVGSYFGKSR